MFKTKLLASVLLVLAVLFAQVGTVLAAPPAQDATPVLGTITDIQTETDTEGVTTVVVTVLDDAGTSHTVRLTVETAATLGLLTLDATTGEPILDPTTGEPVVDQTKIGQLGEFDPTLVIVEEETEDVHPIAAILASFFGMDAGEVNDLHEDGYGFGVIAQALWMAENLDGEAATADMILQAKSENDYSDFVLPDGSTPTNWGQFKKAVLEKKNNLGVIVSGQAGDSVDDVVTQQENGNGNGKGKDKNKEKDNKGNGKNKNP